MRSSTMPAQPIPVALEQVRQRLSVAGAEPVDEMEGVARVVGHVNPPIPLHARRGDSGTRPMSF